ncbi:hypothetical protein IM40_09585 (plasmid) [Candidatus Paracaedimonas acanthamoebae]|nr:hypothetical protein IM40_09585 [Candidatus Paracaedimonas acanthamoebae]
MPRSKGKNQKKSSTNKTRNGGIKKNRIQENKILNPLTKKQKNNYVFYLERFKEALKNDAFRESYEENLKGKFYKEMGCPEFQELKKCSENHSKWDLGWPLEPLANLFNNIAKDINNAATNVQKKKEKEELNKKIQEAEAEERKKVREEAQARGTFGSLQNKYEKRADITESQYLDLTAAKLNLNETQMTLSFKRNDRVEKTWHYKHFHKNLQNVKRLRTEVGKPALGKQESFEFVRGEGAKTTSLGHVNILSIEDVYKTREALKAIYLQKNKNYITTSITLPQDILKKGKFRYEFAEGTDIGLYPTHIVSEEKDLQLKIQRTSQAPAYKELAKMLDSGLGELIKKVLSEDGEKVWGDTKTDLTESVSALKNDDQKETELKKLLTRGILREAKRLTRFKKPKNEWLISNNDTLDALVELAMLAELAEYHRSGGHILARLALKIGGDSFQEVYTGSHPLFIGAKAEKAGADEGGAQAMKRIFENTANEPDQKNLFKLVSSLLINRYNKMTTTEGRGIYARNLEEFEDWMQQALRKSLGDVPVKNSLLETPLIENLWLSSRAAFLFLNENYNETFFWKDIFFKKWLPENSRILDEPQQIKHKKVIDFEEKSMALEGSQARLLEAIKIVGKLRAVSKIFSSNNYLTVDSELPSDYFQDHFFPWLDGTINFNSRFVTQEYLNLRRKGMDKDAAVKTIVYYEKGRKLDFQEEALEKYVDTIENESESGKTTNTSKRPLDPDSEHEPPNKRFKQDKMFEDERATIQANTEFEKEGKISGVEADDLSSYVELRANGVDKEVAILFIQQNKSSSSFSDQF